MGFSTSNSPAALTLAVHFWVFPGEGTASTVGPRRQQKALGFPDVASCFDSILLPTVDTARGRDRNSSVPTNPGYFVCFASIVHIPKLVPAPKPAPRLPGSCCEDRETDPQGLRSLGCPLGHQAWHQWVRGDSREGKMGLHGFLSAGEPPRGPRLGCSRACL